MPAWIMIDTETATKLQEACERARQHPVPLATVEQCGIPERSGPTLATIKLEDRPATTASDRYREYVEVPGGYHVEISFECQRPGLCLHLSMSSPTPTKSVPNPHAMDLILDACGLPNHGRSFWVEQYKLDATKVGNAVNVLQLIEPAENTNV